MSLQMPTAVAGYSSEESSSIRLLQEPLLLYFMLASIVAQQITGPRAANWTKNRTNAGCLWVGEKLQNPCIYWAFWRARWDSNPRHPA